MENLYQFYENAFSDEVPDSNKRISNYLKYISLPRLSKEQWELCQGRLTEREVKDKTICKTIKHLVIRPYKKILREGLT